MSARRVRSPGVVRSVGVVAERRIAPAEHGAARYVALERLRDHVDRVEWAPLRMTGERRTRPASPRLPHALVLHLAQLARGASARDAALDAVVVPVDVDALAPLLGTDTDGVAGALAALQRAGVVHARDAAIATAVALDASLLGPDPRCAALDWARLAFVTAGSPSAWVAAHVLAERLAPDEWTPMPRSALERALGCGVSGVRGALDRLTAATVIERREQRGGVSAYRFAAALQGRAAAEVRSVAVAGAPTGPVGRGREAPPAAPAVPAGARPTAAAATGVRLTVGGVELEVPAGLRVRVELGPDGTPQISLVPVAPAAG